jgi:hypothetical protein
MFAGIVALSILAESAEGSGDKETFHRTGQAGESMVFFVERLKNRRIRRLPIDPGSPMVAVRSSLMRPV